MSAQTSDPYAPPTSAVERPNTRGIRGLEYVGFGTRLIAILLDMIILGVAYFALFFVMGMFLPIGDPEDLSLPFVLVANVSPILVIVAFWTLLGATPGKMMMGIKVVDIRTAQNASFFRCLWRYVCYTFSSIPLGLGYFWVLWDKDKKAWHDHLSGTAVVRRP